MESEFKEKLKFAKEHGHNIDACVRVQFENKFLILRRSSVDSGAGIVEMSGGTVDEGEDVASAAARELYEETGIQLLPQELLPLGIFEFHNIETGKHTIKFAFSATINKLPTINLSHEHDEYLFLTKDEIEQLPRQGKDEDYEIWQGHYEVLMI